MVIRADEDLLSFETRESRTRASHLIVHGSNPTMRALWRTVADVASTDIPILLAGESGTGKEVVALEIHRLSRRSNEPFVKCGCAGMTGDSLAALLCRGKNIPQENNGTTGSLFLDGINHLEVNAQARLLHLLPDSSGSPPQGCCSVRIISSTTRNLEEEMKAGQFREELYYRINGVHLQLPPLRERKEDIPALLEYFLKKYASLFERPGPNISQSTMTLLMQHSWPGNIRELENFARKIVALGDEGIAAYDLSAEFAPKTAAPLPTTAGIKGNGQVHTAPRPLKEASREASRQAERALILSELERTHWNRKRAARELQISYKALLYKLKQLGLDGPSRMKEE
ncbi:MAG TPA: sigma 54-interacting transcriptional regulator [Candidatus Acidoferrales bacterium]|nr:sigma 54-interacting transcriptional regulator [Candidatus Acidoferrales bacterium]